MLPVRQRSVETIIPGDRSYLQSLIIGAFFIRLAIMLLFAITDLPNLLRFSPDSDLYHRLGLEGGTLEEILFPFSKWVDDGWKPFTQLMYYMFGPHQSVIVFLNVLIGTATVWTGFHIAKTAFHSSPIARVTAFLIAYFPLFIYWSCLALKDPVAIFAISMIVLGVLKLKEKLCLKWIFAVAWNMTLLLFLRLYMFYVFIFLILFSLIPMTSKNFFKLFFRLLILTVVAGFILQFAGFGFLGIDSIRNSHYFDIEYINLVRVAMGDHGTGAIYAHNDVAIWGEDLIDNAMTALKSAVFFFVSIDPFSDIRSPRQWIALPAVLLFLILLPSFFRGIRAVWRFHRDAGLVLFLFIVGIMTVISAATTNLGALFRWRMQAMPFIMAIIAYGIVFRGRGMLYSIFMRWTRCKQ